MFSTRFSTSFSNSCNVMVCSLFCLSIELAGIHEAGNIIALDVLDDDVGLGLRCRIVLYFIIDNLIGVRIIGFRN